MTHTPDLTPEPPKPLEVGDEVRLEGWPKSNIGIIKWIDGGGEWAAVRWHSYPIPEIRPVEALKRVPQ